MKRLKDQIASPISDLNALDVRIASVPKNQDITLALPFKKAMETGLRRSSHRGSTMFIFSPFLRSR